MAESVDWDIERNNFEVAMLHFGFAKRADLSKDERGNYLHSGIASTWEGWQKAARDNNGRY